jgi:hypothetical protein
MTSSDADTTLVLDDFLRRLDSDETPDELAVTFGVSGGPPLKRLESEVTLNIHGHGRVASRDELHGQPRRDQVLELPLDEAAAILKMVGAAARELRPRSRRRMPPDSLVGWVVIESRAQRATFRFAVEEREGELRQRETPSPKIDRLVKRLGDLTRMTRGGPS